MRKGEATRSTILDEAFRLATRVGFEGVTIGQLAEQTELSKSGLYAHFASKEQLQLDTLARAREHFIDRVVRPALATERGEPRVRMLFERWVAWAEEGDGCLFVAASAELDDRPGRLRDALVRNEVDWLDLIATVARTAISEGHFREDLDPDQFAYELHGIELAHHHAVRLLRDPRAGARTRTAFESLVVAARGTH
ncbi:TetR family transcriptional regulator [Nocardioides gansuensis]|uniref:TetR family transcriptional regulator n=1 Tax=Nocardioides gansuensis TaxID=2138300 RepID=A0A2T8F9D2_9ACTN|nr:TetR/AcrR family transcriptional regulator [Nocardioides gansuensis]PVG82293.1 TetR family transcriptional regulator [Nocardioides gansuensis]